MPPDARQRMAAPLSLLHTSELQLRRTIAAAVNADARPSPPRRRELARVAAPLNKVFDAVACATAARTSCSVGRHRVRSQASRLASASSSPDVSPQAPSTRSSPVFRSKTRLDAADDPVAGEDRQDVVAVLALRLRHVHLEPVAEVEERLGAVRGRGSAGRTARGSVTRSPTGLSSASGCACHSPFSSRTPSARNRCSSSSTLGLAPAEPCPSPGTSARPGPRGAGRRGGRRSRSRRGRAASRA